MLVQWSVGFSGNIDAFVFVLDVVVWNCVRFGRKAEILFFRELGFSKRGGLEKGGAGFSLDGLERVAFFLDVF